MSGTDLQRHASVEALRQHYTQAVATAINKYISDFIPYLSNFGVIGSSFREGGDTHSLLFLECPLFVAPSTKSTCSSFTVGVARDNSDGNGILPLYVGVLFPSVFPSVPPLFSVMANRYRNGNESKWLVRQPSRTVTPTGAVHLGELSLLKGTFPPYSLLEILLALTEQFELEFPLVPATSVNPVATTPLSCSTVGSPSPSTRGAAAAVTTAESDKGRSEVVQRAAGAIMLHFLSKAERYLDVREQALTHLDALHKGGGALREAQALLEERKKELLLYSPAMGKVEKLVKSLEKLPDSLEEHSKCIVPEDDLQARALELLGEIHSSDAVLELLERSLKAGQLSCEEYVRRVSDVGRKQFEARFLFGRVTEAVSSAAADSEPSVPPNPPRNKSYHPKKPGPIEVPSRLDNIQLLVLEFPEVGTEMVKAALNLAEGNLSVARVQLKAMLS